MLFVVLDPWTIAALKHHCTALLCSVQETELCCCCTRAPGLLVLLFPPPRDSCLIHFITPEHHWHFSSDAKLSLSLSFSFYSFSGERRRDVYWLVCLHFSFLFFLPSFLSSPLINHVVERVFVVSLWLLLLHILSDLSLSSLSCYFRDSFFLPFSLGVA